MVQRPGFVLSGLCKQCGLNPDLRSQLCFIRLRAGGMVHGAEIRAELYEVPNGRCHAFASRLSSGN
jgi:hypothetical protein